MADPAKLTKVKQYLTITTALRSLYPDDAQTEEDAAALVAEGMVQVNGSVVTDRFYGISEGVFKLQFGNRTAQSVGCNLSGHEKELLKFANQKANFTKLREGEVLVTSVYEQERPDDSYDYRLALEPPNFDGEVLVACYYGSTYTRSGAYAFARNVNRPKSTTITECGAKV